MRHTEPSQLERDLNRVATERLTQWFTDSVARHTMVDIPEDVAITNTLTTFLITLAGFLAELDATPAEAGLQLARAVRIIRAQARRDEGTPQ